MIVKIDNIIYRSDQTQIMIYLEPADKTLISSMDPRDKVYAVGPGIACVETLEVACKDFRMEGDMYDTSWLED